MISRDSTIDEIKDVVRGCLSELYDRDTYVLERNKGKGICERSIVFRFAHYLQNRIQDYFVDCDFNSSFETHFDKERGVWGREREGKPIENEDGTMTKRFVDIIVHKRDWEGENDLICFEIKKWNNTKAEDIKKDRNNLRVLTSRYGYVCGFHITIHRVRERAKWTVFQLGYPEQEEFVFLNCNKQI